MIKFRALRLMICLSIAFCFCCSNIALAQYRGDFGPPHINSPLNSAGCLGCHIMEPYGYGLKPVPHGAEQEALCKTCHNPTGVASAKSAVGNHVVQHSGASSTVDCSTCHDPHIADASTDPHTGGATANNLNLMRSMIDTTRVPGVLNPLIFQQKPAQFAFNEGNAPYDGACQACHTETNHHRNNNTSDHTHQIGSTCTGCHPHDGGFLPSGGDACTACHNQPQGSRRQIVGAGADFAKTAHHVLGTVTDGDCVVCHYVGNHGSGTVKLKDPDQSSVIYSYNSNNPAGLENFCLHCHDENGAAAGTGTTPFSDNQTVPDISKGGLWAASAHKTGGATNTGYTCFGNGTTTGCHGNGHGSNLRKMLAPDNGAPGTSNYNEEEGFCYNCHATGGVKNETISNGWFSGTYQNFGDNIQQAFSMTTHHPVNNTELGHMFDLGSGPQGLECTSCHNVHQDSGRYWAASSNYTPISLLTGELWGAGAAEKIGGYFSTLLYQAPFLGESGVDLLGNPLPIDAAGNSLLTGTVAPDYNTLCLQCHQYAVGSVAAIDWTNKKHGAALAEPLNLTNWSGLPLQQPFDSAQRGQYFLNCLDCHEVHGSQNMRLIKMSENGAAVPNILTGSSALQWYGVCDRCHVNYTYPVGSSNTKRHHNSDVYSKAPGGGSCNLPCHTAHSGYGSCTQSGCHTHKDFF